MTSHDIGIPCKPTAVENAPNEFAKKLSMNKLNTLIVYEVYVTLALLLDSRFFFSKRVFTTQSLLIMLCKNYWVFVSQNIP